MSRDLETFIVAPNPNHESTGEERHFVFQKESVAVEKYILQKPASSLLQHLREVLSHCEVRAAPTRLLPEAQVQEEHQRQRPELPQIWKPDQKEAHYY